MNARILVLLMLPLAGCSSTSETQNMPVNILTATPANAQATDMPKIEQTLRPQDVLDVIFHISTSGSDRARGMRGSRDACAVSSMIRAIAVWKRSAAKSSRPPSAYRRARTEAASMLALWIGVESPAAPPERGLIYVESDIPTLRAEEANGKTSPEELIAAAHSACFAMQFSALIAQAGGTPQSLDVQADVTLGPDPAGGFAIALLVPLLARDRALTVGVGLDQAGIDREALPPHAGHHDLVDGGGHHDDRTAFRNALQVRHIDLKVDFHFA